MLPLHSQKQGSLAEWLGTGLQNRLQQFESARNLEKKTESYLNQSFFVVSILIEFIEFKPTEFFFIKKVSYFLEALWFSDEFIVWECAWGKSRF